MPKNQDHIMSCPTPTAVGTSRRTARPVVAATSTRSRMPSMPGAKSAKTRAPSSTSTARTGRSRTRTATETIRIRRRGDARVNSIPVLGTEPASENRIRSCCGSTPGIRFYCKPVTLVRCREIRGENRFSGRVVGKWLCEMTSAFIINELRGARALRLFCGRSSFPPPYLQKTNPSTNPSGCATGFLFCYLSNGRSLRENPRWSRSIRRWGANATHRKDARLISTTPMRPPPGCGHMVAVVVCGGGILCRKVLQK